jgi:hypothetical protein
MRTTLEVLDEHLRWREEGQLEEDLTRNYAEDAVLLTSYGILHGYDGIRASAGLLYQQLEGTQYLYRTRLTHGKMAFLEWAAAGPRIQVTSGADSYLIEHGLIRVQTIHYTLISTESDTR